MTEGVIHEAAVRVGQFKFNICQRFLTDPIQFPDDQIPCLLIDKTEGIRALVADFDSFRRTVQHHAVRHLDLTDNGSRAGGHPVNDDTAILPGDELTVAAADHSAAGIGDQESDALQGLFAGLGLQILLDY